MHESDSGAVARPRPLLQRDINYLLAGFDVGVDVLEHRLEHGVVAHAQVLDLDLAVPGPVLGYLGGVWVGGGGVSERRPRPHWFITGFGLSSFQLC